MALTKVMQMEPNFTMSMREVNYTWGRRLQKKKTRLGSEQILQQTAIFEIVAVHTRSRLSLNSPMEQYLTPLSDEETRASYQVRIIELKAKKTQRQLRMLRNKMRSQEEFPASCLTCEQFWARMKHHSRIHASWSTFTTNRTTWTISNMNAISQTELSKSNAWSDKLTHVSSRGTCLYCLY